MPLRARSVRLSDTAWGLVKEEGAIDGISANQWASEAIMARIVLARSRRNPEMIGNWDMIHEAVSEVCRDP